MTPLERANKLHETYRQSVMTPGGPKVSLVDLIRKEIEEVIKITKVDERKRLKEKYQRGIMKYKGE